MKNKEELLVTLNIRNRHSQPRCYDSTPFAARIFLTEGCVFKALKLNLAHFLSYERRLRHTECACYFAQFSGVLQRSLRGI
jgi:hypothetical protein